MNGLPNAIVRLATTTQKIDNAVGVKKFCWFIAIVNNTAERQCAQKLEKLGYECYVTIQEEIHLWHTGVMKIVNRIILPSMIFIHTTETEHKQGIITIPYINRFMSNRASTKDAFDKHPIAITPDNQIQRLKYILGHADVLVEFEPTTYKLGGKVRAIRGGFTRAESYFVECSNDTYFTIHDDFLGMAKVKNQKENLDQKK